MCDEAREKFTESPDDCQLLIAERQPLPKFVKSLLKQIANEYLGYLGCSVGAKIECVKWLTSGLFASENCIVCQVFSVVVYRMVVIITCVVIIVVV